MAVQSVLRGIEILMPKVVLAHYTAATAFASTIAGTAGATPSTSCGLNAHSDIDGEDAAGSTVREAIKNAASPPRLSSAAPQTSIAMEPRQTVGDDH